MGETHPATASRAPQLAPFPESLCHRCVGLRLTGKVEGSLFLQCLHRSERYLPQPVSACGAFERRSAHLLEPDLRGAGGDGGPVSLLWFGRSPHARLRLKSEGALSWSLEAHMVEALALSQLERRLCAGGGLFWGEGRLYQAPQAHRGQLLAWPLSARLLPPCDALIEGVSGA